MASARSCRGGLERGHAIVVAALLAAVALGCVGTCDGTAVEDPTSAVQLHVHDPLGETPSQVATATAEHDDHHELANVLVMCSMTASFVLNLSPWCVATLTLCLC